MLWTAKRRYTAQNWGISVKSAMEHSWHVIHLVRGEHNWFKEVCGIHCLTIISWTVSLLDNPDMKTATFLSVAPGQTPCLRRYARYSVNPLCSKSSLTSILKSTNNTGHLRYPCALNISSSPESGPASGLRPLLQFLTKADRSIQACLFGPGKPWVL